MPDGAFRIFRSRSRGDAWEPPTDGLPQTDVYQLVLRHAIATDTLDPAGVYVGTTGGQRLASRDEGDHWESLFDWLPPIASWVAVTCFSSSLMMSDRRSEPIMTDRLCLAGH